jgi:solute carrier family 25 carnitine/acylcarnitine transporter 20/29
MGKKLVYSFTPTRTSKELSYSEYAIAGGFSALPTTLIAAPIERIKVLLQVRNLYSPDRFRVLNRRI